jgi:hypothetical protein
VPAHAAAAAAEVGAAVLQVQHAVQACLQLQLHCRSELAAALVHSTALAALSAAAMLKYCQHVQHLLLPLELHQCYHYLVAQVPLPLLLLLLFRQLLLLPDSPSSSPRSEAQQHHLFLPPPPLSERCCPTAVHWH